MGLMQSVENLKKKDLKKRKKILSSDGLQMPSDSSPQYHHFLKNPHPRVLIDFREKGRVRKRKRDKH